MRAPASSSRAGEVLSGPGWPYASVAVEFQTLAPVRRTHLPSLLSGRVARFYQKIAKSFSNYTN